jgi:hypothetical protein
MTALYFAKLTKLKLLNLRPSLRNIKESQGEKSIWTSQK